GPHRTLSVTPDQGVKQGCPISPLLFALYVHDISKEFLGHVDVVRVQGTPATHFMYADDLTLVSTSPHGRQRLHLVKCRPSAARSSENMLHVIDM
ncbi:uncharacterized protein HaLaN_01979, partial [Haematococcus lacustris]